VAGALPGAAAATSNDWPGEPEPFRDGRRRRRRQLDRALREHRAHAAVGHVAGLPAGEVQAPRLVAHAHLAPAHVHGDAVAIAHRELGAPDADGGHRGAQLVAVTVRAADQAGDRTHATAQQAHHAAFAAVGDPAETVFVEAQRRARLQRDVGAVGHAQVQPTVAGLDGLAGGDRGAARSTPDLPVGLHHGGVAGHEFDRADALGSQRCSQGEQRQEQDGCMLHGWNSRRNATDATLRLKSNRETFDWLRVIATCGVTRQSRAGT
jgi:hypothetical protein